MKPRLLRDLGAYLVPSDPPDEVGRVERLLPKDPDDLPPAAAGEVFRSVGRGAVGCHRKVTKRYSHEPYNGNDRVP